MYIFPTPPEGTRYCEEINGFVPSHCQYHIRGISPSSPYHSSIKANLFPSRLLPSLKAWDYSALREIGMRKKVKRVRGQELVMAMGVTHSRLELVSLEEARGKPEIVYRSVDSRSSSPVSELSSPTSSTFSSKSSPPNPPVLPSRSLRELSYASLSPPSRIDITSRGRKPRDSRIHLSIAQLEEDEVIGVGAGISC